MDESLDLGRLKPRALPGFAATPYGDGGSGRYLLRDATQQHFMMTSEAGLRILELLDGERSPSQILEALGERWRARMSLDKLCQFIDACARNRIVDIESWPRMAGQQRAQPQQYMSIDPMLALADRWRRWWCNPLTGLLLVAALALGLWQLTHIPQHGGMLAALKQLTYTPLDAVFAVLPLLFFIEVFLHEAAHALACHTLGARTRGFAFVMLYGVLPGFVTDTAQVNTLRNKYHRMIVSFAGPAVNIISFGLVLSCYQTLDPNSLAARLLLGYSGLSLFSILVNLNPFLLRMDGYWLVADFVEQPNLRRLALRYLGDSLGRLLGRQRSSSGLEQRLSAQWRVRLQYTLYALLAFGWTAGFLISMGLELAQVLHTVLAALPSGSAA